jgi:hypothetical protein
MLRRLFSFPSSGVDVMSMGSGVSVYVYSEVFLLDRPC